MSDDICSDCGRQIGANETPCVIDERVVCRECHDRQRPICPYCGEVLEQRPQSQSLCPKCHKRIIIRTAQRIFPSIYLTAEQAKEVDRYKSSTPATYGCGAEDFASKKRELTLKLGRDPTAKEVIAAVNDIVPATEAQLAYAQGVGLEIPPNSKKNDLSRRLYCYETLKPNIEAVWRTITGNESGLADTAIGKIVSALLNDNQFMDIIDSSRSRDFADASRLGAAQQRLGQIVRQQGKGCF